MPMYNILTPHEYYIVLPALAINAASALHTTSFIQQYIALCALSEVYTAVGEVYTAGLCYYHHVQSNDNYNTVLCAVEL